MRLLSLLGVLLRRQYFWLFVPRLPPRHGHIILLACESDLAQLSAEALLNTAGEGLARHRRLWCIRLLLRNREALCKLGDVLRPINLREPLPKLELGVV